MSHDAKLWNNRPKVLLSCLQCQRRKRKCDKQLICQACKNAGIECVQVGRARRPRGRHVTCSEEQNLQARVSKLERLLAAAEKPVINAFSEDPETASIETPGITDILEACHNILPTSSSHILLSITDPCYNQPDVLDFPPSNIASVMIAIYLDRVDPVFKVMHEPSLRTLVQDSHSIPIGQKALVFAIFFASVNSIDETTATQQYGFYKGQWANRFRAATEVFLRRAGWPENTNLPILQAFVIYIAGLRTCGENYAVIGGLLSSAIRIGNSMRLEDESSCGTHLELELSRRAWHSIGILDLQAMLDGDAQAGVTKFRNPPMHINDSDISPCNVEPVCERLEFCDMTFCCMTHEMSQCFRKMMHVAFDADGNPVKGQTWVQRLSVVKDCTDCIREKYLKYCDDPTNVFQRFTRMVGDGMVMILNLLVRRPLHRSYCSGPPPEDGFDLLENATNMLEHALWKRANSEYDTWSWFQWPKWYVVAVLLAELTGTNEETPSFKRAWNTAEAAFQYFKQSISDERITHSLEQLMIKARLDKGSITTELNEAEQTYQTPRLNGIGAFEGMLHIDEATYLSPDHPAWLSWQAFVEELEGP